MALVFTSSKNEGISGVINKFRKNGEVGKSEINIEKKTMTTLGKSTNITKNTNSTVNKGKEEIKLNFFYKIEKIEVRMKHGKN